MDNKGFSDFEVKETAIRFIGDESAERIGCVGSLDETLNTKTITKKCEGVVRKQVTKGDGTAAVKYSLHIRWAIFYRLLGMKFEYLKDGVYVYGENSIHEEACITSKILDEDGNLKLKSYPRFSITDAVARKIQNGAEEVAELEISGMALPDDDGNCTYEVMVSELKEVDAEAFINTFLTKFDAESLKVASA